MINKMISSVGVGATSAGGTGTLYIDTDDDNFGIGEGLTFHADAEDNIAIGENALNSTTGDALKNIGIGTNALTALTLGDYNTVIGSGALDAADGGESYNVAIGLDAMGAVDEGASYTADQNIAIGANALAGGILGSGVLSGNIAIGHNALVTTGVNPQTGTIAIGSSALTALTTGEGNMAIGFESLKANTGGANNIAIGYQAMLVHDGGLRNIAIGRGAMDATDAGSVSEASDDNIFIGYSAGGGTWVNQDNSHCIGIGTSTLEGALQGNYTDGTIAIGHSALNALTTGAGNMAIGYNALLAHTTGARNMAIGYGAMDGTAGDADDAPASIDNIFVGFDAGGGDWENDEDSNYNVGIGNYCMDAAMDDANNNTAVGHLSMTTLTSGDSNTGIGHSSLTALTAGLNNVAVGALAGDAIAAGNNNTFIGKGADGAADVSGQIAIGYQATTSVLECIAIGTGFDNGNTRTVKIGDAGNTMVSLDWDTPGDSTWVRTSDRRKKRNIKDNTLGLEFINKLQTRTFQMKPQNELPKEWVSYSETNRYDTEKVHIGFIAQELKALIDEYDAPNEVASWSEDEDGMQRAGETKLITPLIKAVQELSAEVASLKEQLNNK